MENKMRNIIIPLSLSSREKLRAIGETLKGKELFPRRNDAARKSLKDVKSLPL